MSVTPYTAADRALLARHVTNVDGNVYCIVNLPEEVIAVIFAYVSRSPRSFRQNLLQLIKDNSVAEVTLPAGPAPDFTRAEERAAAFHARWVVEYGHSSVAEHAVAHVGVEKISRLASAELELANPFLSFTEYSQRYQKPVRGDYYLPRALPAALATEYANTMDKLYDCYEELYRSLLAYLQEETPHRPDESPASREQRLAKVAFEDARYALPLATSTSLGMTGNGRALRDAITVLRTSPLPEVRDLADALVTEVSKVLPTLLRHTESSPYQISCARRLADLKKAATGSASGQAAGPAVELLSCTGANSGDPEDSALQLLTAAAVAGQHAPAEAAEYLSTCLDELGAHDMLPLAFHWIRYDCLFTLSEAAWHQLLRHCRGMHFQWGDAGVAYGYTVPPRVAEARLTQILERAVEAAESLYRKLSDGCPEAAPYAVLNAHRRQVRSELDLRQLYHLVNLRMSEHAQWDIKAAVARLWQEAKRVHPRLVGPAAKRL